MSTQNIYPKTEELNTSITSQDSAIVLDIDDCEIKNIADIELSESIIHMVEGERYAKLAQELAHQIEVSKYHKEIKTLRTEIEKLKKENEELKAKPKS